VPTFDLAAGLRDMAAANEQFVQQVSVQLPALANFDPTTGAVQIDEPGLQALMNGVLPPEQASAFATNLVESARAGMYVGPAQEAAVPWRVLEDVAYARQGLPEVLRRDLGFAPARTLRSSGTIRARLQDTFPAVPDEVFAGDTALLLTRAPRLLPREPEGVGEPDPATKPTTPRPTTPPIGIGTVSGVLPISPEQASAAALCLLNGRWSGWWPGWAGWLPGWKVCIDHDCAERLADVLMGLGGGAALEQAIQKALEAGVATAIKAVATAAGVVLSIIGFLLGLNIKLVNGPNGACIWCNWPYTGGIVFWATQAP
jgi:hypothetical protein